MVKISLRGLSRELVQLIWSLAEAEIFQELEKSQCGSPWPLTPQTLSVILIVNGS